MTTAYPLRSEARARNREALLEAAAEVLAERGYGDASLSAIAGRAGLSTGAVYSIFGSKAELVLALLEPGWGVPLLSELRPGHETFDDVLGAYGRLWRRRVAQPGQLPALELSFHIALSALKDDDVAERLASRARTNLATLADELETSARGFGRVLERPSTDVAFLLTSALQGMAEQGMMQRDLPSANRFAQAVVDLVRHSPLKG